MAGLLDFFGLSGSSAPSTGGLLVSNPTQAIPQPPAPNKWLTGAGLFGAALQDAGANFSGHPADADHLQRMSGVLRSQQILAALASSDPAVRQQAYAVAPAFGIDPKPYQQAQASQATPQLLAAMQPSKQELTVPGAKAQLPAVNGVPNNLDIPAAPTGNVVTTPGLSVSDAVSSLGTKYPELAQQFAPEIIKQQMELQAKAKRTLNADEAKAAGFRPGSVVQVDPAGNYSVAQQSDVASGDKLAQELWLKQHDPNLDISRANLSISRQRLALDQAKAKAENPFLFGGAPSTPGPQALANAPPATQATVKAMLEGRQAPPSSMALKTPYWQNMLALANAADPTFDQTAWGARASARKDMLGGGKSYQLLNSGNTAIQHLGRLASQIGDVSGVQFPLVGNLVNAGVNAAEQASGVPGVNAYNDTLGHLAEETTKFYRGTGGNEADVQRNMANLSPNLSTSQKQAGVANTVHLIYGALQPKVDQYNKTMGTNYPVSHFLSNKSIAVIKQMGFDPDTGEKVSQSTAAPASLPRTQTPAAVKIRTYNPATGKLE